jgi:hypothetical protein
MAKIEYLTLKDVLEITGRKMVPAARMLGVSTWMVRDIYFNNRYHIITIVDGKYRLLLEAKKAAN